MLLRSSIVVSVLALSACGPLDESEQAAELGEAQQAITANYAVGTTVTLTAAGTLRAGPGTGYASLGTIASGTSVKIAAAGAPTDTFYKVTANGKTGWIYGRLMRSRTAVYGYYPDARDAFIQLGITSSRVSQTIGSAAASAGTHAADGTANGTAYSAATDVRVIGLSETQIKSLLESMGRLGLAGWYRKPGFDGWPSSEAPHIHVIYAGAPMKSSLQAQVKDWLIGRNGLVSHSTYKFYNWSAAADAAVGRAFGTVAAPVGVDTDKDGKLDFVDNCPKAANANQLDTDKDGVGDVCDLDGDGDGVADAKDNCPKLKNATQDNADGDALGDACDTDDDNDGVLDTADNCPLVKNANQLDANSDGHGDACQADDDGDAVADSADTCPTVPNADQADLDADKLGDVCDLDDDGDDVADDTDNCPKLPNASQDDEDQNGVGDACEMFTVPPDQQNPDPDPMPFTHSDDSTVPATSGCTAVPGSMFAGLLLAFALRRRR